jgi:S-adenosylmethionine:tRNA ribosyltransferase-isomerase
VGVGTFLPLRTDDLSQHHMHAERGEITAAAARAINGRAGRLVAVGTTSLRLLETAADDAGAIQPFAGETDLFVLPGYQFRAVDVLMTNFHLPRSTLFMLVCAFTGTARMRAAYAHAIEAGYRFYSYGDACLLER